MFEKYLQDIGLSDKEAAIYVALLQVDSATATDIATKTKIKRPTVYPVLEQLSKKGLISEVAGDKISKYQAEPPERLETFAEQQKLSFEEKAARLKTLIPELKSIQREGGERPIVKYYEGKEGILNSMEDLYKDKTTEQLSYLLYPKNALAGLFAEKELANFRETRLRKGVQSRSIYTFEGGEVPTDQTGERLKIDHTKYPINCDISIYGDTVKISILGKKLSGISIYSQDVATTLKSLFKLIFDLKK